MKFLYKKEIVTCSEMKALEKAADEAGLSYYQMMENAGTRAAELILQHHGQTENALVFCGKGNNGGDGFVVARKLREAGVHTQVILVEGPPATNDAKTNYQLIREHMPILTAQDILHIQETDLVVDAIYGTGFHGQLRYPADRIITRINESNADVAALDIPSGLSGDMKTGEAPGICVKANLTIPFHARKPIHCHEAAAQFMGMVVSADLGIGKILGDR